MTSQTFKTTISTKGQVVLPRGIREETGWAPGTALDIAVTDDGVLLRAASPFPPASTDEVFGILRDGRTPLTIEEMDEAITREVKARHARGRY